MLSSRNAERVCGDFEVVSQVQPGIPASTTTYSIEQPQAEEPSTQYMTFTEISMYSIPFAIPFTLHHTCIQLLCTFTDDTPHTSTC